MTLSGMFPRIVKNQNRAGEPREYVRIVESVRRGGKVQQRVIRHLGPIETLRAIWPKLRRLVEGEGTDAD